MKGPDGRQGYESTMDRRRANVPDNTGSYYVNESMSKYPRREMSPELSPTVDAIRMQDLQRTNELLLKELRTANDKYFNERLESKKLKEELANLQKEVGTLKRQRPSKSPVPKRNLTEVVKENDSLRQRIEKLEQECNSLTYYRENMLSTANGAFSIDNFDPGMRRANQESDLLRNKLESTTIYVKRFMLAMKRLQRGIKNKDPNNKSLKMEFERCKKELEDWCRALKEEFSSVRSPSKSIERSVSPAGTYSRSRGLSPNILSPGDVTPKEKGARSRFRSKNISQNRGGQASAAVASKPSRAFASMTKGSHHGSNYGEINASGEISRDEMRQPNFDDRYDVPLFSSGERVPVDKTYTSNVKPTDLSRTTFGIKTNPKASTERHDPTTISQAEYEELKIKLAQMVEEKENELKRRLNVITDDLNKKTLALNKMKRTLVSKLKELEESLIETNREYQRSLEVDAMIESSQEERGESQIAELMEQKRRLEKESEQTKDLLEVKIRENQDLSLELKKYKRDLDSTTRELEETLAKQKAGELENQMKLFEVKELDKFKDKLSVEIVNLQNKLLEQEEEYKKERAKAKKDLEAQIYKMQEIESQQIKSKVELSDKLKKKDKELALKASLVDDFKNKVKHLQDEINELKIQNKTLSITKLAAKLTEDVDADSYGDDPDDEEGSRDQEKKKEIKELLNTNPTKATEELYRLWTATAKEYRILKKAKTKMEDEFEELKMDIDDLKKEERVNVEKMLVYEVKLLENEKEKNELKKLLKTQESENADENANVKKYIDHIDKLNIEIDKLTKKLNSTSDLHRNLKIKEKKLESSNKELNSEIEEYRRKISNLEMELEMSKSQSENDLNRLVILNKQAEEEKDTATAQLEKVKKQLEDLKTSSKAKSTEFDTVNQQLESLKTERDNLNTELEKANKELQTSKDDLQKATDELESVRTELENTTDQLNEATTEKDQLSGELETLIEELENTKAQLTKANEELEQAKGEKGTSNTELETTRAELDQTKAKVVEVENSLKEAQVSVEDLQSKLDDSNTKLEAAESQLEDTKTRLEEAESEHEQVKQELEAKIPELEDAKSQIESLTEDLEQANKAIEENTAKHNEELQEVKSKMDEFRKQANMNESLKYEIEQNLEGITEERDNLQSQLTTLQQKLTKTTEDLKSAKEEIEELKESNQTADESLTNLNEEVATLLEQLDTAKKASKSAQAQVAKLQSDLESKESELASAQKSLDEFQTQIDEKESEITELNNKLTANQGDITKLQTEKDTVVKENNELKEELESARNEVEALQNSISETNQILTSTKESEKTASEHIEKLKATVEDLRNEISSTSEKQTQEYLAQIKELEDKIESLEKDLSASHAATKNLEAKVSELTEKLNKAEEELESAQNNLSTMTTKLNEQKQHNEELAKAHTTEISQKDGEIEKIQKGRNFQLV